MEDRADMPMQDRPATPLENVLDELGMAQARLEEELYNLTSRLKPVMKQTENKVNPGLATLDGPSKDVAMHSQTVQRISVQVNKVNNLTDLVRATNRGLEV